MPEWENYYEALEIPQEATLEEVRRAYRAKAMALHPDRLQGVADEVRNLAEEKLKQVNRANEVLSDPDKKRKYDEEWLRRFSPPRPEVDPGYVRFDDVTPRQRRTGSFVIRNAGGPFANIRVSNPESWVTVTGYRSLTGEDELPLRVDLEAAGREWGRSYDETITVGLDDQETQVRVRLRTKSSPTVVASIESRRRARKRTLRLPFFGRMTPPSRPEYPSADRGLEIHVLDGAAVGMRWGGVVGGVGLMGATVVLVVASGYGGFVTIILAPSLGMLFGVFGAVLGAVAGGVVGALGGIVYGARKGS